MKKETLGMMISAMRKEKGMTQSELAAKMGVTDKAVSKWERDLSCPDIQSVPALAEIFGISVDELMQVKKDSETHTDHKETNRIIDTVLKAIPVAMGVAVIVLSVLSEIDMKSGFSMLGIAVVCIALPSFRNGRDE